MSAADIEAGRSFVTLYVRDKVFKQQMADNERLYQEAFSDPPPAPEAGEKQLVQLEDQIQGYDMLEQTASHSMSALLQDTEQLAEQTERLNDALEAVMSTYGDLSGMQEEGVTLSVGGGGHGGGGNDEGWLDTGQIEHTVESGLVGAMGKEVGSKIMNKTLAKAGKIMERISNKASDKLAQELEDQAMGAMGNLASRGQKLLTGPVAGGVGKAAGAVGSAMPNMGSIAAATKGADIVMAEAVPAMKSAEIVMAEIVPAAGAATSATAGLTAGLAAMGPAAAIAAAAAVVLVPVLAAIDNATGGTLSESGYYPEWLKKIGDTMLMFSPIGVIIDVIVLAFKELWAVVKTVYDIFSVIGPVVLAPFKLAFSAITTAITTAIKIAFLPLNAVLFAINAPFKAVHLVVDSVKAGFALAQTAVVKFVDGLKAMPGILANCAAGLGRMAASAAETVKNLAAGAWNAAVGAINGVSSALQTTGKWMAIVGGSMAAVGAVVVGPLTKAAETFAHHGKEIHQIAEEFDLSSDAAATYAYMASQTGRSVKDLTKAVEEGSDEFARWQRIAEASGWTIGESETTAVSLCHAYKELKDALHGLWVQLGQAVAPAVEESTRLFTGAVRIAVDWARKHQDLIATAFKVASTIAAVGSALATAGGILISVGAVLSPFTVALAGIAAGLAAVEYKTQAGVTVWGAYKDSLFNVFGTAMSWIKPAIAEVTKVVDGIKDAILAGKIDLVFDIVVNEIKAVWAGGLAWLAEKTGGIFGDILGNLAAGRWQAAADGAMGMLTAAFLRAQQTIDDVWEGIKSVGATVWSGLQDGFDMALTKVEVGFVRLLDKLKDWGIQVLQFFKANVIDPIAEALSNSALSTFLGISNVANKASTGLVDAQLALQKSKNATDPEKEAKRIVDAAEDRRAKRHEEEQQAQNDRDEAAVGRWVDRRDAIAAEGKRGGSEGATAQSDANLQDAIKARDEAIVKARAGRDAMGTPEDPGKAQEKGSFSGLVTTSAYAFGQFSTGDPAKNQVEELKKARLAKAEEKKQRDKEWAELLYWQKVLGTKDRDEIQSILWDFGS